MANEQKRRARYGEAAAFIATAVNYKGDDCLIWPFATQRKGYGHVRIDGKDCSAHSVVCEAVHGPAPDGREAAHSCRTPPCINPQHLRWDTRPGNHADKLKHGTHDRGERHSRHKLTEQQVLAIRASKEPQLRCAQRYGVSKTLVRRIRTGKQWAWLGSPASPSPQVQE